MSRVEIKNRPPPAETRSYRLDDPPSPSPASPVSSPAGFDAITAALQATPSAAEGAASPERAASPAFAALPPALDPSPSRPGAPAAPDLVGYRDAAADTSAPAPSAVGEESLRAPADSTVPRGTLICVYLLTTVDTANPAAVLQFGAARGLVFHRRPQLPFGTRFLGRLVGPPARDRLNLTVDAVLFPDGLELPISASVVEADEEGGNIRPGIAADYFPPPTWVQVAPYVSDFATGYLGLLESRAQRQFTIGLGGALASPSSDSARPPLYEASAQAIQDFTQARLKEISQRYASHFLVPAGTACWLQLEADLDLRPARSRPSLPSR
jgi:hypothetical protein